MPKIKSLYEAASAGDLKAVKIALDADKTSVNKRRSAVEEVYDATAYFTPLIAAVTHGHSAVVEELIKAGADVNCQFHRPSPNDFSDFNYMYLANYNLTPLELATTLKDSANKTKIIKALVISGARICSYSDNISLNYSKG